MTDVVGSVAMWERNPTAASEAIAYLEKITESLAQRYHGVVHKKRGEGDSFFLTFESPSDAIHFAADWNARLQNEQWPTVDEVVCRIAIRTGLAESRDGDYYGVPINRCARMRSLAGRKQIVICSATCDLVREDLPAGTSLEPGGEIQLRDVEQAERLYLLLIDGVECDSKLPLGGLQQNHNMPPRLTSFVGRELERERTESALRFHRLITLLGPGGSGKTRLSEEIAESFSEEMADGAWFVALADCRTQSDIEQAIFRSIRAPLQASDPNLDSIVSALERKHTLLVIDNCEHLVKSASKTIHRLLSDCPRIRILATSRSPLGLIEESVLQVGPFELPKDATSLNLDELRQNPAVQLFLERAVSKDASLELMEANAGSIARICQRLDGIALAIEQAASHAGRLSVEQIADRLDKSFSLLKSAPDSVDPRHETMIATIDWSVELQSDPARQLFFNLANMVGSWPLEGAIAMGAVFGMDEETSIEVHGELIDSSLVQRFETPDAGTRYRFLETVREFALSKSPILSSVQEAHMNWCLSIAKRADQELLGPNQASWLRRLEWESGNLKQALEFAFANETDDLVHLAESLKRYWVRSGLYSEGAMWLERALSIGASDEPRLRASMLNALGACRWRLGESDVAERHYRESLVLWEAIGDQSQIGAVYTNLAICATDRGALDEALHSYEKSIISFEHSNNLRGLGSACMNAGFLYLQLRDFENARRHLLRSVLILEDAGHVIDAAYAIGNLGWVEFDDNKNGCIDKFVQHLMKVISVAVQLHDFDLLTSICKEAINRSITYQINTAKSSLLRFLEERELVPPIQLTTERDVDNWILESKDAISKSIHEEKDFSNVAGFLVSIVEQMAEFLKLDGKR